eukprot:sb/3474009/
MGEKRDNFLKQYDVTSQCEALMHCSIPPLLMFYFIQIDIVGTFTESDCLVPFPERFIDMFRPSVGNCSFCQIDSIPTKSNITDVEFYEKYAYSGMPVLVTDGMKGWETDQFNLQFFKELYSNVTLGNPNPMASNLSLICPSFS